jgi:glycerol-3-phosphate acyltransferase PlsY
VKRIDTLIKVIILLTIVLFICAVDDLLSLHDISKDYVSKGALQHLEVETSKALPAWTNTELEWFSVQVSYIIRFIAILISLFLLVRLRKNIQNV